MQRNWTLFEFGMNVQRRIYNQEVTNEIKVALTKSQDYENVISNNRFWEHNLCHILYIDNPCIEVWYVGEGATKHMFDRGEFYVFTFV